MRRLALCCVFAGTASGFACGAPDSDTGDSLVESTGAVGRRDGRGWDPVGEAAIIASMNPAGWWRLGETSGTTAADSSSKAISGTYINSPTLGVMGAIIGDPNTAVRLAGPSREEYVEVPDHDLYSLTRANDAFDRAVGTSSTWGTADHGGAWAAQVTTGAYYSCDGGVAQIDETTTAATWQQGLGTSLQDCDLQVRASWTQRASGGSLAPVALVARMLNTSNFYRAELREDTEHSIELRIAKTVGGTTTVLSRSGGLGSYNANDWWYVRFQLEGSSLRARAWKRGTTQPTTWTATATDSSLASAGTVSIRSSNSGSTARPTVSFEDFWLQTLGLTVHVWMRPDVLTFAGETSSIYIHWLGKGVANQYEWGLRFYSDDSPTRPSWISAYAWNLEGGIGAGAAFRPPAGQIVAGTWYQIVARYDSGDAHDTQAGVTLFKDGLRIDGPPTRGTLYSTPDFLIYPRNGKAPLRFGTRDADGGVSYFTGALDEVAVFSRRLTDAEVRLLYTAAR
jgi:hypothetical protein